MYWAPAFIIILSDLISPTIRPDLLIITVPLELTLPIKVPLKTRFIDFKHLDLSEYNSDDILCFFDCHQNAYLRLKQCIIIIN